jgi:hypothetical protein
MGGGSNQAVFQFHAFDAGLLEKCRHGASFHLAMQSKELVVSMAVALGYQD